MRDALGQLAHAADQHRARLDAWADAPRTFGQSGDVPYSHARADVEQARGHRRYVERQLGSIDELTAHILEADKELAALGQDRPGLSAADERAGCGTGHRGPDSLRRSTTSAGSRSVAQVRQSYLGLTPGRTPARSAHDAPGSPRRGPRHRGEPRWCRRRGRRNARSGNAPDADLGRRGREEDAESTSPSSRLRRKLSGDSVRDLARRNLLRPQARQRAAPQGTPCWPNGSAAESQSPDVRATAVQRRRSREVVSGCPVRRADLVRLIVTPSTDFSTYAAKTANTRLRQRAAPFRLWLPHPQTPGPPTAWPPARRWANAPPPPPRKETFLTGRPLHTPRPRPRPSTPTPTPRPPDPDPDPDPDLQPTRGGPLRWRLTPTASAQHLLPALAAEIGLGRARDHSYAASIATLYLSPAASSPPWIARRTRTDSG